MSVILSTKPSYRAKPIGSLKTLAKVLGVGYSDLMSIAGSVSGRYTSFLIAKRDGTFRDVVSPNFDLKVIQKRINRQIFELVEFPEYLFGGLQGRNYVDNAALHSHAEVVIALDVENFYGGISSVVVERVFKDFFRFPTDVAEVLTKLTTLGGKVPQGACTSSYLANLVFYQLEPRLVESLTERGLKYSRLLDDISISSRKRLSEKNVEGLIQQVAAMLKNFGLRIKNKKTKVMSSTNPENLMEITGLWLNRGVPRVKRAERLEIRSEARRCITFAGTSRTSRDYHKEFNRTSGRVAKLMHLKHDDAKRIRNALRVALPFYGSRDIYLTKVLVDKILDAPSSRRSEFSYLMRYNKLMYRLNILARSDKPLADTFRSILSSRAPTVTREGLIYGGA